jgi:sucrose-6-phosphate hydrolase SacC (GH32 family)
MHDLVNHTQTMILVQNTLKANICSAGCPTGRITFLLNLGIHITGAASLKHCLSQVVFPRKLDKTNMTFDADSDMKRIGGPAHLEQQVTVQVYVDHSAVEVFLSSGEALATRYVMSLLPHHSLVSQIQGQGAFEDLALLHDGNTL